MQKIYFAALAIAAMTSCAKNEVTDVNPDNPNKITFGTYSGRYTRATDMNMEGLRTQGFGVYAKLNPGTFTTPYINNDYVTWRATSWGSTNDYYWNGKAYDFYAYSPIIPSPTFDGISTITNYPAIAGNASAQQDIIVAVDLNNSGTAGKTVNFSFSHALSKVDFTIAAADGREVVVNSFMIQGVLTGHSGLNLVTTTAPFVASGTLQKAVPDYTYLLSGPAFTTPLTIASGNSQVLSGNTAANTGGFMLLPQTLSPWVTTNPTVAGARIVINYTYMINGQVILDNVNAAFPLPAGSWEIGRSYMYTLTFDGTSGGGYDPDNGDPLLNPDDKILFDVTDGTWGWTASPDQEVNL